MSVTIGEITAVLLPAVTIIAVLVALLSNYQSNKMAQRYNEEKNKAELEMLRANFESKIYSLNERLVAREDRWMDSNHLLVKSSINKNEKYFDSSVVNPDKFLSSMGVYQEDLVVKRNQVFILTPFHEMFDKDYYNIEKTCLEYGFGVSRGDENYIKGDILAHILKRICESELIIANITGRNPNVFYELGLAHALGKPVIIISKGIDDIPFDLRSKQILVYKESSELSNKLRLAIANTIRA
ncbi:hypothetical protein V9J80_003597 [Vibrio cholerae]|nr:hypothetical protein [Vibrio cholerae]EJL6920354.1 hypothetical protein [Vibrio cholerae]EKF9227632.1 hypothetical protein [Vibrio cholerae]HDI3301414.1 hypothetical protein [Vibrio cholerae]